MKNMFLLLMISLCFFRMANAQNTYYVATHGAYANNGTSTATPWNFSRLQAEVANMHPGDMVLLNRGNVFEGTLTISNIDGTAINPITFGAYGTGLKPVITGASTITDTWALTSGTIWQCSVSTLPDQIRYLFRNGVKHLWGRHPNTGWHYMNATNANNYFTDPDRTEPDHYWDNAYVVTNLFYEWGLATRQVSSYVTGSVYLNTSVNYGFNDALGYMFINHINTLDIENEWAYNSSTHTLYVCSSSNPNNSAFAVSVRNTLVNISNSDYIIFENIEFNRSNSTGINAVSSHNLTIRNCEFYQMPQGIETTTCNYSVISQNILQDISDLGIRTKATHNTYIEHNTLKDIASLAEESDDEPYGGSMKGIYVTYNISANSPSEDVWVRYNSIDKVGYSGIHLALVNRVYVVGNSVTDHCWLKLDGGGIYAWHNSGQYVSGYDSLYVANNYVKGTNKGDALKGRPAGTTAYTSYGLYFDDGNSKVTFKNNLLTNNRYGIFIHNSDSLNFYNNIMAGNQNMELRFVDDGINTRNVTDISMYHNKLAAIGRESDGTAHWAFSVRGNPMPLSVNFKSDNNYYMMLNNQFHLWDSRDVIYTYDLGTNEQIGWTYQEWMASAYAGKNDKDAPFVFDSTGLTSVDSMVYLAYNFSDNNYVVSDNFWNGYCFYDVDGRQITSDTLAPYEGNIYIVSRKGQASSYFAISSTKTNVKCNGGADGSINLNVTGGVPPYSYLWTPGNIPTKDRSGLTAGTYSVQISDADNHHSNYSVSITQPDLLKTSAIVGNTQPGLSTGFIHVTITGGTSPCTYLWTPGGFTTKNISELTSGTYSLTVTDANSCNHNNSFKVDTSSSGSTTEGDTIKINFSYDGVLYSKYVNVPADGHTPISLGGNKQIIPVAMANWGGSTGMTGSLLFPDSVSKYYHYNQNYGFGYKFVLKKNKLYDFEIYASRNITSADRVGRYWINNNGTISDTVRLDAAGNVSKTVKIKGIVPVNDTVTLYYNADAGSTYAYLNAVWLHEFDIAPVQTSAPKTFNYQDIKLYPIPCTDFVYINTNIDQGCAVKITVINSMGQTVLNNSFTKADGNSTYKLNTSGLPKGIYILQITINNTQTISKKMVK